MAAVTLAPADLTPFATIEATKAQAMIDDALALAARVAPCITEDTFEHDLAARAILRGAILRWNDAGTGALKSVQIGSLSQGFETGGQRRSLFWPSEIKALQELCIDGDPTPQAFAVDTTPVSTDWAAYEALDSWA